MKKAAQSKRSTQKNQTQAQRVQTQANAKAKTGKRAWEILKNPLALADGEYGIAFRLLQIEGVQLSFKPLDHQTEGYDCLSFKTVFSSSGDLLQIREFDPALGLMVTFRFPLGKTYSLPLPLPQHPEVCLSVESGETLVIKDLKSTSPVIIHSDKPLKLQNFQISGGTGLYRMEKSLFCRTAKLKLEGEFILKYGLDLEVDHVEDSDQVLIESNLIYLEVTQFTHLKGYWRSRGSSVMIFHGGFDFEPDRLVAQNRITFRLDDGLHWKTPLHQIGHLSIKMDKPSKIPLIIDADLSSGEQHRLSISASDIQFGTENGAYHSWRAGKDLNVQAERISCPQGRFIGVGSLTLKSKKLDLGNDFDVSVPNKPSAACLTNGKLTLDAPEIVGKRTVLKCHELNTSFQQFTHIGGEIHVRGDATLGPGIFTHRIDYKLSQGYDRANSFDFLFSFLHNLNQKPTAENLSVLGDPPFMQVQGRLNNTGTMEIQGGSVYYGSFTGNIPNCKSVIPVTYERHWRVVGYSYTSHWFQPDTKHEHFGYVYNTNFKPPVEAVFSSGSKMEFQQVGNINFSGIMSAPTVHDKNHLNPLQAA